MFCLEYRYSYMKLIYLLINVNMPSETSKHLPKTNKNNNSYYVQDIDIRIDEGEWQGFWERYVWS